jgi:O-antigen/teichoic acid export membrane protein
MARVERNRIVKLLGAGTYGQIVTIIYQLGLIPITIGVWGAPLAADWVIITSLAAYLSFSDLGFSLAAGNRMCHAAAAQNWTEVSRIYRCSLALTLVASLSLIGVFVALFLAFPIQAMLKLSALNPSDFAPILICQAILVVLGQMAGAEGNLYRAGGRAAFVAMFGNTSRLIEFCVVAGSILLGAGLLQVAVANVVTRAISSIVLYVISVREFTEIGRWSARFFDVSLLKELFVPSIGFMAFPVAFAFGNQFLLTAISATGGPLMALAFSSCRTLTRILFQCGSLLAGATAVNFTFAFGQRDFKEMRRLFHAALNLCFWGVFVGAVFLAVAGPTIYALWTHREVPFNYEVFCLLLADALLAALWFAAMAVVGSANRHSVSAWMFAGFNILVVGLAFWLVPFGGLAALSALLLAVDFLLFLIVVGKAAEICEDRLGPVVLSAINPMNLIANSRFLVRR